MGGSHGPVDPAVVVNRQDSCGGLSVFSTVFAECLKLLQSGQFGIRGGKFKTHLFTKKRQNPTRSLAEQALRLHQSCLLLCFI